jgi:hypothetical protein
MEAVARLAALAITGDEVTLSPVAYDHALEPSFMFNA